MNDSPEQLEKRIQAGKQGRLLTIEVCYDELMETENGNFSRAVRRYVMRNMYWSEVMEFRKTVYTAGLMYAYAVDHWRVVHPMEIKSVDIHRQRDFFK